MVSDHRVLSVTCQYLSSRACVRILHRVLYTVYRSVYRSRSILSTQSTTHQTSELDEDELACRQLSRRGVASGPIHSCPLQYLLTVNTAFSCTRNFNSLQTIVADWACPTHISSPSPDPENDILTSVFRLVDVQGLLRCERVCKGWHDVLRQPEHPGL